MLKDNHSLTDALVQLINAMPESEREKIASQITKPKSRIRRSAARKQKSTGTEKSRKNYDLERVTSLLSKIKKKKVFENIEDPVQWQKKLRDEWQ